MCTPSFSFFSPFGTFLVQMRLGLLGRGERQVQAHCYSSIAGIEKVRLQREELFRRLVLHKECRCQQLLRCPPCQSAQVPMSRFEQEEFVNDRYKAMEDRLKASGCWELGQLGHFRLLLRLLMVPPAQADGMCACGPSPSCRSSASA